MKVGNDGSLTGSPVCVGSPVVVVVDVEDGFLVLVVVVGFGFGLVISASYMRFRI